MLQLTRDVIDWIKDYYSDNPDGKAIIGISGGKDSTICAKLLVEALGKDRVVGVLMPNGEQKDIEDSYKVCKTLGIHQHIVDIYDSYRAILNELYDIKPDAVDPAPPMIATNLPARLRMAVLYAVAALYPNSRVVNTSNYSERYVGYSTKFGDSAGDFSPLGNLTMTHVLTIGDDLGLPHELVHKAPSDGMSGKTDEDNLGFTYKQVDDYLHFGRAIVPDNVNRKIQKKHRDNLHKLVDMPRFTPTSLSLVLAKKGNGGI